MTTALPQKRTLSQDKGKTGFKVYCCTSSKKFTLVADTFKPQIYLLQLKHKLSIHSSEEDNRSALYEKQIGIVSNQTLLKPK